MIWAALHISFIVLYSNCKTTICLFVPVFISGETSEAKLRQWNVNWTSRKSSFWSDAGDFPEIRYIYQFSSETSGFLFADVGLETINCESHRDESEPSQPRQHFFTFLDCNIHCLNLKQLSLIWREKSIKITAVNMCTGLECHLKPFFFFLIGLQNNPN